MSRNLPVRDVLSLFAAAESAGRVGTARKTKSVDARPAHRGEIVSTYIADEGKETQSKPADLGDWIVRNRCPETGNEMYLVKADTFGERYKGPLSEPDAEGWCEFKPNGPEMRFFTITETDGAFLFTAPWGEEMVARVGDVIVRDPKSPKDTYRVAAASFKCTYDIISYIIL
jgi:hypothetical protein